MTDLPLPPGAFMTPDHRYYFNREGPAPSVTTVLDVISKPALMTYKAKETAKALMHADATVLAGMSEDEQILWALKEGDKARDQAASLGSSVHLLADIEGMGSGASRTGLEGFQVSDDTKPYLEAYRAFLDRYSASSIVSSEHMVWSANGYAGTYDLLMMLPSVERFYVSGEPMPDSKQPQQLWLIDIKTAKSGPYPEWGLQLAGYRWADSIILPGDPNPYPMPEIQRTGVLHLRPDLYRDTGWRLIEYPTTWEKDYVAFLAAVELHKWKSEGRFTKSQLSKP